MAADEDFAEDYEGDDPETPDEEPEETPGKLKRGPKPGSRSAQPRSLRLAPVEVSRRQGNRDYRFVGELPEIPTKTEIGRMFGPGVYKLTCKGGGRQNWTIGHLELPASEPAAEPYQRPAPGPPRPEPMASAPTPQGAGDWAAQVFFAVKDVARLLEWESRQRERAAVQIEAQLDGLAAVLGDLEEAVTALQAAPKEGGMLEKFREMAEFKALMGDMGEMFGPPADPNSPWTILAPELRGISEHLRGKMNPFGGSAQAQGTQPPAGAPGPSPQPAQPLPDPEGMTPEAELEIRKAVEGRWTWEQAKAYAAHHKLSAVDLIAIVRGEKTPPQ